MSQAYCTQCGKACEWKEEEIGDDYGPRRTRNASKCCGEYIVWFPVGTVITIPKKEEEKQ